MKKKIATKLCWRYWVIPILYDLPDISSTLRTHVCLLIFKRANRNFLSLPFGIRLSLESFSTWKFTTTIRRNKCICFFKAIPLRNPIYSTKRKGRNREKIEVKILKPIRFFLNLNETTLLCPLLNIFDFSSIFSEAKQARKRNISNPSTLRRLKSGRWI